MFLPDVIVQKKTTEKIKHIKKPIMYQNDQCSISKSHKSKNNNISIKFVSLNHFWNNIMIEFVECHNRFVWGRIVSDSPTYKGN